MSKKEQPKNIIQSTEPTQCITGYIWNTDLKDSWVEFCKNPQENDATNLLNKYSGADKDWFENFCDKLEQNPKTAKAVVRY